MSVLSSKLWHSLTEPVAWTKTRVTQRGSFSVSTDTDNDNYLLLNTISHVYITRRSSWPVVYVHLSTVLIRFAMLKVFASSLNHCKTRTVSDGCVVFLWNCTNKKCPRTHTHTLTCLALQLTDVFFPFSVFVGRLQNQLSRCKQPPTVSKSVDAALVKSWSKNGFSQLTADNIHFLTLAQQFSSFLIKTLILQ